jgi:hypothetical protein
MTINNCIEDNTWLSLHPTSTNPQPFSVPCSGVLQIWPRMYFAWPGYTCMHIQSVPGGKVSILGGHSMGLSKQKIYVINIWVLFRTVSEIELFHSTVPKLLIRKGYLYYVLFLITVFIAQVTELVEFA